MKKGANPKSQKKSPQTPRSNTSSNLNLKPEKSSTALRQKKKSPKSQHSPSLTEPMAEDSRAQIAQRAHELYEHRGRVHGSDFEDWLKAEREVMGQMSRS